jgi:hypothetical protein
VRDAELRLLPAAGAAASAMVASRRGVTVYPQPGNDSAAPHFAGGPPLPTRHLRSLHTCAFPEGGVSDSNSTRILIPI